MASAHSAWDGFGPATLIRRLDGPITYWSPEMAARYGFCEAEALGARCETLLCRKLPQPLAELDAALRQHGSWTGAGMLRGRDGCWLMTVQHWHLHCRERGQNGFVTELHADPQLSQDESSQIGDVLATVAHALSEPMTAAGGYVAGMHRLMQQPAPELAAIRSASQQASEQMARGAAALGVLRAVIAALRQPSHPTDRSAWPIEHGGVERDR